jgi:8'-apo-carotenoid 13,14-cleaving dioxygenase
MACSADHGFPTENDPPVSDETNIANLPLTGTLPAALSGRYLVIGSNPTRPPQSGTPASGAGMVHAITVHAAGTVSYRNRWITTDAAAQALGTEPVPGPRRADNDVVASNIITFGSTILALGDGALAYELTADLTTRRRVDLAGAGRGLRPRVHLDRHTGALHLLGAGPGDAQTYVTVSAGAMTRATRPLDDAPRVHDLTVTRDHVVFLADGHVGVTPRPGLHEATVAWIAIGAGARRLAGVHDDAGGVVVYTTGPALERWTLGRRPGTVELQILDNTPLTFPIHNRGALTCPRRYLWTCSTRTVHRHDLVTGRRTSHPFGAHHQPAELAFVADPSRVGSEDGGWLVGVVHDRARAAADLVVLDAHAIDGPPIATVHIPRPIPNGTHATWIPTNH